MGFDKVGAAGDVQGFGIDNVVVHDLDVYASFCCGWKISDQFSQFGSTDTVCTVNCDMACGLPVLHCLLECRGDLLVVPLFTDFAIFVLCAFCIYTSDKIVQLRCGEELVVGIFGIGSLQSVDKRGHEGRSRCSSIASINNTSRGLKVDFQVFGELVVGFEKCFVGCSVRKGGCIGFPRLLETLIRRIFWV